MTKRITIIGAGGNMGRWFSKYFLEMGFDLTGYDSENTKFVKDTKVANSLVSSILDTDYVLLCTPTRRTPEIIRLIAKEMKKGTYLIDISSEKSKTIYALSKIPAKINPVCIHPMFGPGSKKLRGKNIISVPVKDAKKELAVAKSLFPTANFVTIDSSEHDKKIAVILGLTHLMNLVFANILSKDDKISLTEKMSGTTFKIQKILAESIMTESTDLIETIVSNPDIRRVAEMFWKDVGTLLTAVQDAKTEVVSSYVNECKARLDANSDPDASYKKLISMIRTVER